MNEQTIDQSAQRDQPDDESIKGTAKEAETKRKANREALATYQKARDAALPWPVHAVRAILDYVLRRRRP